MAYYIMLYHHVIKYVDLHILVPFIEGKCMYTLSSRYRTYAALQKTPGFG